MLQGSAPTSKQRRLFHFEALSELIPSVDSSLRPRAPVPASAWPIVWPRGDELIQDVVPLPFRTQVVLTAALDPPSTDTGSDAPD